MHTKLVATAFINESCSCVPACFSWLRIDVMKLFGETSNSDAENGYLNECITVGDVKRKCTKTGASKVSHGEVQLLCTVFVV